MKILMIHPHDIYSPKEPWTIRIKQFAREFLKQGHHVRLVYFSLSHDDAYRHFSDEEGIEVVSLSRRVGVFYLMKNIKRMISLAKGCDIVHFQKYNYYASLPALIAALVRNVPIHYDWDDWETNIFYYSNPGRKWIGKFISIFERLLPTIVDSVSVSGKNLRNQCVRYGVPEQKIVIAPVGADTEMFMPLPDTRGIIKKRYGVRGPLVVYVGQLHGGQYVELFIQALKEVVPVVPGVKFMIVGDGYRRPELEQLARECGVDAHLIFTGIVDHKEIPLYMNDADVCVACFEDNDITRSKSPLKIVEYMACGKAIVASNVGEVRNMLGGVGVLTEPGNPVSLAEGIAQVLQSPTFQKRLEEACVHRVQTRYNWRTTAQTLLAAYQNVID